MPVQLTGSIQSVPLGSGYALRAPGLQGIAELRSPASSAARAAAPGIGAGHTALDAVLRAQGMSEVKLVDLSVRALAGAAPNSQLRSAQGAPQLELEVPDLGADVGQIVLSIDDAGAVRWHLPLADAASASAARGTGGGKRFRIPASFVAPPPAQPGGAQRSILGAIGRRLLKVLVYPVTDPVIGAIGTGYASRWEARNRPYRLRSFTPENYRSADVPALGAAELERIVTAGPSLLFVHGTFSTSHGGFGDLPVDTLHELHARYSSRVVAFDHPTLADAPDDNVRWLLAHLPAQPICMDIVCHSRGGLVARVLAERMKALGLDASHVDVRRIVFGAVPNAGTALADPDHMVDMIDRLTTVVTLFPTGPVTETLEALLIVIKVLGHGGLNGLKGLASMHPGGELLAALNQQGGRRADYFAVTSNYEPTDQGLRALVWDATDRLADGIFGDAGNDLVVPADGVWQSNGSAGFPLQADNVLAFGPAQGVMHTELFVQKAVSERLLAWLT